MKPQPRYGWYSTPEAKVADDVRLEELERFQAQMIELDEMLKRQIIGDRDSSPIIWYR